MKTQKRSIPEIEDLIYQHQNVLQLLPRVHFQRANYLVRLVALRVEHYGLSNSLEQLEICTLNLAEALFLPLHRTRPTLNPIQLFFDLALFLLLHSSTSLTSGFSEFKRPHSGSIKYCVQYFRYFRNRHHPGFDVPRDYVTSRLVFALGLQVRENSGDIRDDIKEMTSLCRELLNSNISINPQYPPTEPFMFLGGALQATTTYVMQGELGDQVIDCLRDANIRFPSSHALSLLLVQCLNRRFILESSIVDYEEATSILTKFISSPSDLPKDFQKKALEEFAFLSCRRYSLYRKPEYLEEAISHIKTSLRSPSLDDPLRITLSELLRYLADQRLNEFGFGVVQEERHSDLGIIDLSSMSSLTASLIESNSPPITYEQWEQHLPVIYSLMRNDFTDIAEIEEGIKYCRVLVVSISRDPGCVWAHTVFMALDGLLYRTFELTNKIEYVNEAIAIVRDAFKMHGLQRSRKVLIQRLIRSLYDRFTVLCRREDLDELMQLLATMVNDNTERVSKRILYSCMWTKIARQFVHPSVTTAYEGAFSLMQDYLSYAPTLEIQHFRLTSMRESYQRLVSSYALYQIDTGHLDRAIETLERGRALLWSEMRGNRGSADQLSAVDSALATKFAAVNRELEQVTMSMASCGNMKIELSEAEGPWSMDPFGRLVVKKQKLLEDRDKFISQIRALPDFCNFLKPPSFDDLRSAALSGPVVIINHCEMGSDILILFHNIPPSLITMTDDFYDHAVELSDRLVKARKDHNLESKQYQRALRSVLAALYELVGRPVIKEFHKMKIPEQSRVWWCPTSVFCSLPLHAMGPITSDDGVKGYFSDLYIPSYTTTLSALIESRRPGGQTSGKPSILLVAQPESLQHAIPEIWAIQRLDTKVTSLLSEEATPSSVMEGLRRHQFSHFVCHGSLEPEKPFNASFKLYRGKRLTLLEIVRSQLPTAECAFLSACHTAEMTEESIPDEALHLTAAMQHCGFRSVVGTMWAMADEDGQALAEDFYTSILSSKDETGVPYYQRSARALRDAVKNLRITKRVSLERWVNYVHYGA